MAQGFRSTLSLDHLLDFWLAEAEQNHHGLGPMATELNRRVAEIPELRGALEVTSDSGHFRIEVLERHRELVETLFLAILPPGLKELSCTALAPPGSCFFFHATPRFSRELLDEDGHLRGELLLDGLSWEFLGRLYSYLGVLKHCYNIHLPFEKSVLVQVENAEDALFRTYQLRAQFDMMKVRPIGALPQLDLALLQRIQSEITSFDLWRQLLPSERFEYHGLMVYEATEVTEEITRSQLTELLVRPEPLIDLERFSRIEKLLRTLFRQPNLELAVIGIEGDMGFWMDGRDGLQHDLDPQSLDTLLCPHDRSDLSCGQTLIHADLALVERNSAVMESVYRDGARSFLMLPLAGDTGLKGALVLTTDQPGQLSTLTKIRLKGIASLFMLALARTLADVESQVQAVLKEKFTSIHPAVEWKFRGAALNFVRTHQVGDVLFPDVYSLYSASDIRSSSEMRNRAIQSDLIAQIETAKRVLQRAEGRSHVDYLNSLIYRLERLIAELDSGVGSSEEARIAGILSQEVEPVFASLEVFGDDIHESVEEYRVAVRRESGSLYRERRAYEESVDALSLTLTAVLTRAQERAQAVFPHLFQMYRTDGVEHSIYVGNSLTQRLDFSPLYLKDLRLWQLRVVVGLARAAFGLEQTMPVRLQVAHLILAQSDPIGLRFSQEEKKFNVDGAYNTRYEIIKKRIDKAHVRGRQERVTQPGTVAIFYSSPQEEQEYRLFIDYLQQRGELTAGIERIDVEDLQGVHGLKALRVAVETPTTAISTIE